MNELYLALDTETGGLAENVSLLSAYLQVLDKSFNVLDELELYAKPNDGVYLVEAGGLSVNKIDLINHDKVAVTYSEAGQKLYKFLQKNSNDGKLKLIPLGKNVHFDIQGLYKHLVNKKNAEKFVSYRNIDITTFARCLQIQGKIPANMSLSLFSLADLLNVTNSVLGNPHEAKYDTLITVAVFKGLLVL
jgi:hypothetical protein